jgi:hypothetical protein
VGVKGGTNRVTTEGHGFDIEGVQLVQVHDLGQDVDGSRLFSMHIGVWY